MRVNVEGGASRRVTRFAEDECIYLHGHGDGCGLSCEGSQIKLYLLLAQMAQKEPGTRLVFESIVIYAFGD